MISRLLKNVAFVTFGSVVENLVAFLFVVYVARALGPAEFGRYVLIGVIIFLVERIVSAGLGAIFVRMIAREQQHEQEIFSGMLTLRLLLSMVAYGGLWVVIPYLDYDIQLTELIRIYGLGLFVSAFVLSFQTLYVAREHQRIPVFFNTANRLIAAVVGIIVLQSGGGVRELIIATLILSLGYALVWAVFFWRNAFSFGLKLDLKLWGKVLRQVFPIAPMIMVNQVNRRLSIFMLSKVPGPMPGDVSIGLFHPALAITDVPVRLFMRLRVVFLAWVARGLGSDKRIISEFVLILQLITIGLVVPMIIVTYYFPDILLGLVFGSDYIDGASVLRIVGFASAISLLIIAMEGFIFATYEAGRFVVIYLVVLVVNIVLCWYLIPVYGKDGAAIALLITRLLQFIAVLFVALRYLDGFQITAGQVFLPMVVLSLCFIVAWVVQELVVSVWLRALVDGLGWCVLFMITTHHLFRARRTAMNSFPGGEC